MLSDCILTDWCTKHKPIGYGRKRIKGKLWLHHRWVWTKEKGPIGRGLILRHRCDNPSCINLDHLELGTQADNVKDRDTRGRTAVGADHGKVKLDASALTDIFTSTLSNRALGRKYKVTHSAIAYAKSARRKQTQL